MTRPPFLVSLMFLLACIDLGTGKIYSMRPSTEAKAHFREAGTVHVIDGYVQIDIGHNLQPYYDFCRHSTITYMFPVWRKRMDDLDKNKYIRPILETVNATCDLVRAWPNAPAHTIHSIDDNLPTDIHFGEQDIRDAKSRARELDAFAPTTQETLVRNTRNATRGTDFSHGPVHRPKRQVILGGIALFGLGTIVVAEGYRLFHHEHSESSGNKKWVHHANKAVYHVLKSEEDYKERDDLQLAIHDIVNHLYSEVVDITNAMEFA